MDKDFMQINEKELTDVVGGLSPVQKKSFMISATSEDAISYLRWCGITPSDKAFHSLMKEWREEHS